MSSEGLTQNLYQSYIDTSYFFSILFQKDVLHKLDSDYKNGIVHEENLVCLFNNYIDNNPDVLGLTSTISNNLSKIISNLPLKYLEIVNKIKIAININKDKCEHQKFLSYQYLCRKYGVSTYSELSLKQKIEFSKLLIYTSSETFNNLDEKIPDFLEFDFNLIYSLHTLLNSDELFDRCINNYKFLSSINYFKCNYPAILEEKLFLYFALYVLEYNKCIKRLPDDSDVFGDFDEQNNNILKYLKRKVNYNAK